jgi:hypothetical protein
LQQQSSKNNDQNIRRHQRKAIAAAVHATGDAIAAVA